MTGTQSSDLLESLKKVATVLREAGVRFALAGSAAVYARGGPAGEHDVDFVVHVDDVTKALAAATEAGLRTERPPEGWLVKVYDGECLVDLIFRFYENVVDDAMIGRAEAMSVAAVEMPVLDASDLVVAKLLSFSAHNCDFGPPLLMVRVLREQIDWRIVRTACDESPYARAFLWLVRLLGIADDASEERPWTAA
ncbi:MAG TPA: nucleotidyltransferase [Acidothermaceae bacterium]|nr:nucleotidyltransferase [Acidothermaceae bacterium]